MSDKPRPNIWLMTLFWGYTPKTKMHAVWGVRNFPDEAVPFIGIPIKVYRELKQSIGDYILGRPGWDFVEEPLQVTDFVAIRVDFIIEGEGDLITKVSSLTQTEDSDSKKILAMFLEWVNSKLEALIAQES